MYVSACIYLDGVHVMPGPDCPHGPGRDTEGNEDIPPGWTVQQAPQEGSRQ